MYKRQALDCANGSAWSLEPHLFEELGAEVAVINNRPNGLNINDNAGSTHIGGLQKFVVENSMDVGLSLIHISFFLYGKALAACTDRPLLPIIIAAVFSLFHKIKVIASFTLQHKASYTLELP